VLCLCRISRERGRPRGRGRFGERRGNPGSDGASPYHPILINHPISSNSSKLSSAREITTAPRRNLGKLLMAPDKGTDDLKELLFLFVLD
jgi:hypothetical protein